MRYVLAIVSLAISGVLLLLGIGQRTFLAGPAEIVYPITAEPGTSYAVLDGSELAKVGGQPNVVMRGETAFAALANTRDAAAWLEPFDHSKLSVDPATQSVESSEVAGTAPNPEQTGDLLPLDEAGAAAPLDPRGSDLWLEERVGESGVTRMPLDPTSEQSIIIAGTGDEPIPKGASLVWVQDRATPWAGPLLVAGGAFAVLGVILQLLAFDRDKRALGPRRGRRGPLLGVRNWLGGSGRKAKKALQQEDAPRRGSLENTPVHPEAGAAVEAATPGAAAGEPTEDSARLPENGAQGVAVDAVQTEGPSEPAVAAEEEEILAGELVEEDAEPEEILTEDAVSDEAQATDEGEDHAR